MKLNCDMGESFGAWHMGHDEAVMPHVHMANLACGFHASDPAIMAATIELAKAHKVSIGAHPSYPDLQGFGRRDIPYSAQEIRNFLLYQLGALDALCRAAGTRVEYVKPHGALYNRMMREPDILRAVFAAVAAYDKRLPVMVLADLNSKTIQGLAEEQGVPVLFEAFCDRAYTDEAQLVRRGEAGALLDEQGIEQRIDQLVNEQSVTTVSGKKLSLTVDTICVHGDHPDAAESVKKIRKKIDRLSGAGFNS